MNNLWHFLDVADKWAEETGVIGTFFNYGERLIKILIDYFDKFTVASVLLMGLYLVFIWVIILHWRTHTQMMSRAFWRGWEAKVNQDNKTKLKIP